MAQIPVDFAGTTTTSDLLPLIATVWVFAGVAIWIVERWRSPGRPTAPVMPDLPPGSVADHGR